MPYHKAESHHGLPRFIPSSRDSFSERKAARTEFYFKWIHGWVLRTCTACNGSGYYDSYNSPPCGCCQGTGKMRVKP